MDVWLMNSLKDVLFFTLLLIKLVLMACVRRLALVVALVAS